MRRRALTGSLQHLCLWALVLFFGAFSALAPGTMPDRQQGGLTIVLCTGYGVKTVTIGPDGEPITPEHKPCDWNQHLVAEVRTALELQPRTVNFYPAPALPPAVITQPKPRPSASKRARAPPKTL